jgi:hypothetical protein
VDLVFALAFQNAPEEAADALQAPPAVPAEAARALATAVPVVTPISDDAEAVWSSPLTLGRAGVFLLGFAAAAFCGKKGRDRLLSRRPALKTVVAE